jgi:hypothetical protein
MMQKRYELIMDPMDHWIVWDSHAQEPAMLGFAPLIGLKKTDATIACTLLNDAERHHRSPKARKSRDKSQDAA